MKLFIAVAILGLAVVGIAGAAEARPPTPGTDCDIVEDKAYPVPDLDGHVWYVYGPGVECYY